MASFGPKVGQIGPKWDRSEDFFSDQISVHFDAVTLFRPKSNIPELDAINLASHTRPSHSKQRSPGFMYATSCTANE